MCHDKRTPLIPESNCSKVEEICSRSDSEFGDMTKRDKMEDSGSENQLGTDCAKPPEKVLKEGDYLRMRVDVNDEDDDDDQLVGVNRRRATAAMPTSTSDGQLILSQKSANVVVDDRGGGLAAQPPSSKHSRFAEKFLRFLHCSRSEHSVTTKRRHRTYSGDTKKHAGGSDGVPHRRRFVRVVTDNRAPPPDKPNDNPNIVVHYSQQYLTRFYADKENSGEVVPMPYEHCDHSILKKSSTDPSCNREKGLGEIGVAGMVAMSSGTGVGAKRRGQTVSVSEKHATFSDVVTVFDTFDRSVTEEKLHDVVDGGGSEASSSPDNEDGAGTFFLDTSVDGEADDFNAGVDDEDAIDLGVQRRDDGTSAGAEDKQRENKAAMMNIFASFNAPPDALDNASTDDVDSPGRSRRKGSMPTARQVDLKSLMEAMDAVNVGNSS